MKRKEIRDSLAKSKEELIKKVQELQKEVRKISVERSSGRMKNTALSRDKKKEIAQILTIIKKKELEEIL